MGKHGELASTIQVENLDFFYISDEETNFTVAFVSQNIVTQENFIKFRDNRNFTFFEATIVR